MTAYALFKNPRRKLKIAASKPYKNKVDIPQLWLGYPLYILVRSTGVEPAAFRVGV